MKERGFQAKEVLDLTGVTYRQLDHWSRSRIVTPKERQSGDRVIRVFGFEDLVLIRAAATLLESGVNFPTVKKVVGWLRGVFEAESEGNFLLAVDGDNLKLLSNDPGEIMEHIRGKCVLTIDIGQIIKQLTENIEVLKRKSFAKRRPRSVPRTAVGTG